MARIVTMRAMNAKKIFEGGLKVAFRKKNQLVNQMR